MSATNEPSTTLTQDPVCLKPLPNGDPAPYPDNSAWVATFHGVEPSSPENTQFTASMTITRTGSVPGLNPEITLPNLCVEADLHLGGEVLVNGERDARFADGFAEMVDEAYEQLKLDHPDAELVRNYWVYDTSTQTTALADDVVQSEGEREESQSLCIDLDYHGSLAELPMDQVIAEITPTMVSMMQSFIDYEALDEQVRGIVEQFQDSGTRQIADELPPNTTLYMPTDQALATQLDEGLLMPADVYSDNEASRARTDHVLRTANLPQVPTEPGWYHDKQGAPWLLDSLGGWTDQHGTRRDHRYAPFISLIGPMTPVEAPTMAPWNANSPADGS